MGESLVCSARAPYNGQMQHFEIYLILYVSLNSSSSQQHIHLQYCKRQDQNDTSNYFEFNQVIKFSANSSKALEVKEVLRCLSFIFTETPTKVNNCIPSPPKTITKENKLMLQKQTMKDWP